MQVTLTFDTDQLTLANVYQMLVGAKQAAPPADALQANPVPVPTPGDPADQAKANRQAAAANARAAKGAKPKGPVETVLGPDAGPPNGEGQPDDDMGLVPPAATLSPGEAKDQALALVREIYAAGKVAEVKVLQKEWQVAKFYDVPVERGHEFHQRVMKLAHEVGIRQ